MKIAFINTYGNGSTGKIVDALKEMSIKNGFEVRSYYAREYCASTETAKKFYSKIGFYADAFMTRVFDNHGLNNRANTKRIINDLEEFNPDIIHIHNLHGYWINYEMLLKYIKRKNIKVVFTLHDCWNFTGHCTHFDFINCQKWKTQCFKCPQKGLYPKASFFDGSKRNYRRKKESFTSLKDNQAIIVCPSEWLKTKVEQSYLGKYKCLTINNGVNTEVFKPIQSDLKEKYGLKGNKVILAVANYWDEKKGLNYVLELAKSREDLSFVYIGKEKAKNSYNLNNVIHIERTDSQKELAMWYSIADIYINPTLEDNYPTTNLEAVACGTPVITFNTGGSPEIVNKTNFGLVCEEKTVDSLSRAINQCSNKYSVNNNELEKMRLMVNDENKFEKYIQLYKELLKD